MNQGHKRSFSSMDPTSKTDSQPSSSFMPMFETFRKELDDHHDRRERIIKASRDITAASKKIIFALQRVRTLNQPLPQKITKTIQPHTSQIHTLFSTIAPELVSINAHRYNRQISPGLQEYMEARIFQHYLETQTILGYDTACGEIARLASSTQAAPNNDPAEEPPLQELKGITESTESALLTPEDYLLALFDATGELMRHAITSMATASTATARTSGAGAAAGAAAGPAKQRTVVQDLQALRVFLCNIEARSRFVFHVAKAVGIKMGVMLASVDKVERALYGLCIRGGERPAGWMPDLSGGGGGDGDEEG